MVRVKETFCRERHELRRKDVNDSIFCYYCSYVLGRSQARNEKAIDSLGAQGKERAVSITCDLDSLASVRLAADAFYVQEQRRRGVAKEQVLVDVVVANAGVFTKDTKERSQDGFEKMWAT